jgi:hypothetical protein
VAQASRLWFAIPHGIRQLKKRQQKKIYQRLVQGTIGIWKKDDSLAYLEKLRTEWEQRLQDYRLLQVNGEDNL